MASLALAMSLVMPVHVTIAASDRFFTVGILGYGAAVDGHLELQIGDVAWTIERAGFQLVETAHPQTVAIWRTSDCRLLLRFRAGPTAGLSRNTVDLGDGTGAITHERTGYDSVPTQSIADRSHAPSCRPPDTSTAATPAATADPSPFAAPDASVGPAPSPTPLPWPTIPAPVEDPDLTHFDPNAAPAASARRQGVVVEMWLSAPSVGQGEYVQAIVRATNTRSDPVWMALGECGDPATTVDVDLSSIVRPGLPQTGLAAGYKRRAVRASGVRTASFERWRRSGPQDHGIQVSALAECTGVEDPAASLREVGSGATIEERFLWYPGWDVLGGRWQPLPPGFVPVTVAWYYAGHGRQATPGGETRPVRAIVATTDLELTGTDATAPSVPELVDSALADPRFGDWVRARPADGRQWVTVIGWPGPTYPSHQHLDTLAGRAPNGIVVLGLQQKVSGSDQRIGAALVDPWTAEVVDVVFE
jgi:hypothetical protein